MRILCVIPVRGGSKGIPGKNMRAIAGKPLLVWSVEQALAAEHPMDVVVSTDSQELAAVALEAGALVPFLRPSELAQDTSPTEPSVIHAIQQMTAMGKRPDAVMLLQATSPIRHEGTIDRAISQFIDDGLDSLVGTVAQTPFLWRTGETALPHYEVGARPRRQDLAPEDMFYRETGSLYLTKTEIYLEAQNRIGGKVGVFVMDEDEGVDIDTPTDFLIAEQILLALTQN